MSLFIVRLILAELQLRNHKFVQFLQLKLKKKNTQCETCIMPLCGCCDRINCTRTMSHACYRCVAQAISTFSLFWPLSAHYGCCFLSSFYFVFFFNFFFGFLSQLCLLVCGVVRFLLFLGRCGLSGGEDAADLPPTH